MSTPARYEGIDFTPPEGARAAARRALDVRAKAAPSARGMTPVGLARARDLVNGRALSPATVRRMLRYFQRHEVDKQGSTWDEQGKGWQAWNGWGGDAGYAWARKVVGQMDARDERATETVEPWFAALVAKAKAAAAVAEADAPLCPKCNAKMQGCRCRIRWHCPKCESAHAQENTMQSSEQIRGVVHVREAAIQIPEGQSLHDVLREVSAAVEKAVRDAYEDEIEDAKEKGDGFWLSVEDLYADSAIVHARSYGDEEPINAYHRVAWSRLATGEIATGTPVEVERRVSYVPAESGGPVEVAQEALRRLRFAVLSGSTESRVAAERDAGHAVAVLSAVDGRKVREALSALREGRRADVLRLTDAG